MLPTVFVDRHGGTGRRIQAVRQAGHGNLHHPIELGEHIRLEPVPLIAHHQHHLGGKVAGGEQFRAGGLLETHQLVALVPQPIEHWRKAAVDVQHDRLSSIAGDPLVQTGGPAGNHPANPKAAAGAHDVREVHMAPHRRAGHDQFAWLGEFLRRAVPDVFEAWHGSSSRAKRGRDGRGHMLEHIGPEARPHASGFGVRGDPEAEAR